jgi:hypothetical protein
MGAKAGQNLGVDKWLSRYSIGEFFTGRTGNLPLPKFQEAE